ncbi:MAG: hypothetical protein AAFX06_16085 [Planctomycetota bacterium]
MAEVVCTKCGQKLKVGEHSGPVKITCPKCGQSLILRSAANPAAPAPQAAQASAANAAPQATAPQSFPAPAKPASLPQQPSPAASFPQSPSVPVGQRAHAKPRAQAKAAGKSKMPLIVGSAVAGVVVLVGIGFAVSLMIGKDETPADSNDRIAAARERAEQMRSESGFSDRPRGPRGAAEIAAETERMIAETNRAIDADIAKAEANAAAGKSQPSYVDTALVSDVSGHRRAVADFVSIAGQFGDLLEQTKGNLTPDSRASLSELRDLAWKLSDRIAALPRLDSAGAKEASKLLRLDAAGMERDKRVQQQVEQFRPRVQGRSNLVAFNKAVGRLSEARNSLITSMMTPKKPFGLVQDLEYRLYDANRAILHAALPGNQAAVGDAIVKYTKSLRAYKDTWGRTISVGDKPFSDTKSPFVGWYAWSTGALERHVEPTLSSDLSSAYKELMDLQASFEPQDMTATERIQAKHAKLHQDAMEQHQKKGNKSDKEKKATAPEDDWALGQQIKFFRGEKTKETVIVFVDRDIDFFKRSKAFMVIKTSLGLKSQPRHLLGNSVSAIGIEYDGSLENVAQAISFGKVSKADEEQRVLYCDVADEWASED